MAAGKVPLESYTAVHYEPDIDAFELDPDTVVLGSGYQATTTDGDGNVVITSPQPEQPQSFEIDDGETIVISQIVGDAQAAAPVYGVQNFGTSERALRGDTGPQFRVADQAEWDQLFRRGIIVPTLNSTVPASEPRYESLITRVMKDDGKNRKAKSRIVLNGPTQVGDEYTLNRTRTATPRYSTIRTIIALAAATVDANVYQFDVPNAFGQAPSDRTRYMRASRGQREYIDGDEIIYAVQNLYGGRTAGRNYQNHMAAWLQPIGFEQCPSGPATFIRAAGTSGVAGRGRTAHGCRR